jgi:hypothetical protein
MMMIALKSASRTARQVVTGLHDLVQLLRWAHRSRDRRFAVTSSSVTLPDF